MMHHYHHKTFYTTIVLENCFIVLKIIFFEQKPKIIEALSSSVGSEKKISLVSNNEVILLHLEEYYVCLAEYGMLFGISPHLGKETSVIIDGGCMRINS